MNVVKQYSILSLIFVLIYTYHCIRIIPERAQFSYINEKYLENASGNVRRYGRRTEYVANAEFITKYPLGNNVTIDIIFYEYLHNEYRPSFIEMHFKLCDFIFKDPYAGLVVRNKGIVTCPMLPGKYSLPNMTFNFDHVPKSIWPFERGKITMTVSNEKVVIAVYEMVCKFISKLPK